MNGPPPGAYAAALSLLPGAGPVSLQHLLAGGDPEQAWADVVSGRSRRPAGRRTARLARAAASPPAVAWDVAARRIDVAAAWARLRAGGIGVTWWGRADYPGALRADPSPPAVLFWRGSLDALDQPCVALVGTRHATAAGRALAFDMGRDLAAAGVCVVSGLALGIDGASHRGALQTARPGATVGVAASGVDRVYPVRHRALWEEVVALGAVVSETPPGRPAQTWRFPARNRIIAGLVSMVVVVESHATGGSLITADAAIERGIEVRAVPGPVQSPASAGTNQLLYDGPGPVRDATDVLIALGTAVEAVGAPRARRAHRPVLASEVPVEPVVVSTAPAPRPAGGDGRLRPAGGDGRPAVSPAADEGPAQRGDRGEDAGTERGWPDPPSALLAAMGWQPRSLNWIVARSGSDVATVAAGLDALVALGRVSEERGWWQRLV